MQLRDPELFRQHAYIDGAWVDPVVMKTIPVVNPATEEPLYDVAVGSKADVDKAVAIGVVSTVTGGLGREAWAFYPPELAWGLDAKADLGATGDPAQDRAAAARLLGSAK